ncbi:MAG: T9SS type A sorting domain-containing protein [Chitinophagaceae bacterium]
MNKLYIFFLSIFFAVTSVQASNPKTVGIGDGSVKVVRFYPNPASAVINFEFKGIDKSYNIQVFNFLGKRMVNQAVTSNKIAFSLETFYRGLYVFQLRDQDGNIVESGKFQVVK